MDNKIERQKIVERDKFTYDERKRIALKSGDRCCHCGKLVYFGFGATVDHFIPLSKGGTNRDINMVMMCEDCNKEKNNKIVYPGDYLPYLNKEDLGKLERYFDSYVQSFEFISRNNVLSCDEYMIRLYNEVNQKYIHVNIKTNNNKYCAIHALQKATMEDKAWLVDYLRDYLKKRNQLDDETCVSDNIEFWLRFGCIYYIKGVDGVKVVTALTFCKNNNLGYTESKNIPKNKIRLMLFPKYANDRGITLTCGLIRKITDTIAEEQGLDQLPVDTILLETEPMAYKVFRELNIYKYEEDNGTLIARANLIMHKEAKDTPLCDDQKLNDFFAKTEDIVDEVDAWLLKHPKVEWMRGEIFNDHIERVR